MATLSRCTGEVLSGELASLLTRLVLLAIGLELPFFLGPAKVLIRLKNRLVLLPSLGATFSSDGLRELFERTRLLGGGGKSSKLCDLDG